MAMAAQLFNGVGNIPVSDMADEIQEEDIFPGFLFHRPTFNLGQVNLAPTERFKHPIENSGLVFDTEHDRRFIIAALFGRLPADHQEAGKIMRIIFDLRFQPPADRIE